MSIKEYLLGGLGKEPVYTEVEFEGKGNKLYMRSLSYNEELALENQCKKKGADDDAIDFLKFRYLFLCKACLDENKKPFLVEGDYEKILDSPNVDWNFIAKLYTLHKETFKPDTTKKN